MVFFEGEHIVISSNELGSNMPLLPTECGSSTH